jgi:hypothetical protein
MKVSVVPAQITTLEDRIIGKLGLSQLLLLVTPVFSSFLLYIVLPPNMHNSPYKIFTICILILLCSLLAIRIKSKIVLLWLVILLKYWFHPRLYVSNKNTQYLRVRIRVNDNHTNDRKAEELSLEPIKESCKLSAAEKYHARRVLANPDSHMTFQFNKKGVLNGSIREVET